MRVLTSICLILFGWLNEFSVTTELSYEVIPERIETVIGESETLVNFDNSKFIRRKRDYFAVGNFSYLEDMSTDYVAGVETAYSSKGNNQFIRHPFRLAQVPVCEYFNTTYKKYIEPMFLGKTNFPKIPPNGLCPIPKGIYTADHIQLDKSLCPIYVPRGLWRLEEKFYKKNKLVGGIRIYAKVVDK